jgi:Carboxypeptidase regulatory-like domain
MKKGRWSGVIWSFLPILILWVSAQAWAQVTAAISGRVEDATGAAVGAATVTVKSVETRATRMVSTDETGKFRVLSLPVGVQEVRVEKPGFKSAVRTGINLFVGQEAVVNLRLEVGQITQEVTVSGCGSGRHDDRFRIRYRR